MHRTATVGGAKQQNFVARRAATGYRAVFLLLGTTAHACTGQVNDPITSRDGEGPGSGLYEPVDDRPRIDPTQPLDCSEDDADPGPTILARLTRWEYLNTVRDLFGLDASELAATLPFEVRAPLSTTSVPQSTDFKHAEVFSEVAQAVVETLGDFTSDYASCDEFRPECEQELIQNLGFKAFRKPLRPEEVESFRAIFRVVEQEGDTFAVAAQLVLRSLLQSPQFLYHLQDERGNGLRSVDPYELANRLSYLVWHSAPDAVLLNAAESGELETTQEVEAQVRRMAADPRARAAAAKFFEDWVDLTRLERAVSGIDAGLKASMREETERFVGHVLWERQEGLRELLSTDLTFVDPALAEHYGLVAAGSEMEPYDLSDVPERRGVLTHASLLAAHANGNRPAIVSRGLFVLRSILCREIPDPPATLDTSLTELPESASGREKSAERLGRSSCGPCHQAFDPLAYVFERYDGQGRTRDTDDNGNPLTTEGWIPPGVGSFPADDPRGRQFDYSDLNSFVEALVDQPFVGECLAATPLHFNLRRELDSTVLQDACVTRAISDSVRTGSGSYEDLLVGIATHRMFSLVQTR